MSLNHYHLNYSIIEKYAPAARMLSDIFNLKPDIAIIAGSGFSDVFDDLECLASVSFSEIPGLSHTSVAGHAGLVKLIRSNNHICLLFAGRYHTYEGKSTDEIVSQILISKLLGINNVILSNAAGTLNAKHRVGEAMLVRSSINFLYRDVSILFKEKTHYNDNHYCDLWLNRLKKSLVENNVTFSEGVYLSTNGPTYETRAETRLFRLFGADAVGMSTVLEAAFAKRLDMNCIAISLITNQLSETSIASLTHDHVIEVSKTGKNYLKNVLTNAINTSTNI